jgi:uncharacterized protein (TIGR03086 family)
VFLRRRTDTVAPVDDLKALEIAGLSLERRLSEVGDDQLARPSACTGWSVYDLVNHVNGGGHRYLLLLRGAPADQLAATRTQDHVRPDPLLAYRRWQRPLVEAFAEPDALHRVVHHPVGDRSGLDLLRMRTLDLTLHAWDLARSLGLDDTVDAQLCGYLLSDCMRLVEELRGHGLYAPAGEPPTGQVSLQHELLQRTGRS